MPQAENTDAACGMITFLTPSSRFERDCVRSAARRRR